MERRFRYDVAYPDNHNIPLSDVAATLLVYERVAPILGRVLEELNSGLVIEKVEFSVREIRSGSLYEAFFVAIFLAFQNDLEEEVPALIETLTGVPVPDDYNTIVTVLVLIILFAGTKYLFEGGRRTKATTPPSIQGNNNLYLNIAAGKLGVSAEEVEKAVSKAIGKRELPKVARAAVDFFRPSKRGPSGRIVPRGLPEIPKEATAEFPSEATLSQLGEDTVPTPIPEATLEVRATDRDHADRGWGGRLVSPSVVTKRLPLKLYPTVDRDELAAAESCVVEAVLESKPTESGDLRPIAIHVVRILYSGRHPKRGNDLPLEI